jgi:hypothetical protein
MNFTCSYIGIGIAILTCYKNPLWENKIESGKPILTAIDDDNNILHHRSNVDYTCRPT